MSVLCVQTLASAVALSSAGQAGQTELRTQFPRSFGGMIGVVAVYLPRHKYRVRKVSKYTLCLDWLASGDWAVSEPFPSTEGVRHPCPDLHARATCIMGLN